MEEKMIVTISRQYGCGGSKVAKILADKMGVWCYDRDILTIAAERIGNEELTEDVISQINYKSGGIADAGITGVMGAGNIPVYNQMFLEQARIIQKLANYGSAVFLGRCADYILRNFKNCVSVYLYADQKFRENRVVNEYHESIEKMIKEDKSKAEYYQYYTGKKWGDLTQYDFALNTAKITFEEAADLIYEFAEKSIRKDK